MTYETEHEVKVKIEPKANKVGRFNIPYTDKAKKNLEKQQRAWMKKKGEFIRVDDLAAKLLETASL